MAIPTKMKDSIGRHKAPAGNTGNSKKAAPSPKGGAIATKPAPQIPNTNKFAGEKFTENCELTLHTTTPNGVQPLTHDSVREAGVSYSHPSWNESYIDRSDRVPQWNQITGFGLEDKDAQGDQFPLNHGKEVGLVQGYHKTPTKMVHDMSATATISQGGVLDDKTMTPSYKQSGFGYYKITPTSTSTYGPGSSASSSGTTVT